MDKFDKLLELIRQLTRSECTNYFRLGGSSSWFSAAICIILLLAAPLSSHAGTSLSFVQIEESKYIVKGEGLEGIAALNITVDYDSTYPSPPQVNVMGGELLEEERGSASSRGSLRLRIQRQDPGTGFEICIYFQESGDYPAAVNFVTAEAADLSGTLSPVPVTMVPLLTAKEPESANAVAEPASTSPEAGEERLTTDAVDLQNGGSSVDPPAWTPAAADPHVPRLMSTPAVPAERKRMAVHERFRDFSDKKSLAAFTTLFSGDDPRFSQNLPVLISDGRRTARVVFNGVGEGDITPLFAVSGGEVVSVAQGAREGEWIVTVRPDKNAWDVRVRCAVVDGVIEFPLIVAPTIEISSKKLAKIDEKAFMPRLRKFLAGKPTKGKPKYPAWLKEYIFTANYLAARHGSIAAGAHGSRPDRTDAVRPNH